MACFESKDNPACQYSEKRERLQLEAESLARQLDRNSSHGNKSALGALIEAANPLDNLVRQELSAIKKDGAAAADRQAPAVRQLEAELGRLKQLAAARDTANTCAAEGFKTAALFARGPLGLAATASIFALDAWRLNEKPPEQMTDLLLGSLQGVGTRAVFSKLAAVDPAIMYAPNMHNLPARAAAAGMACRAVTLGFSRESWTAPSSGKFDPVKAVCTVSSEITNPLTIAADVMAFAGSGLAAKAASRLTGGGLESSPFLSNVVTAGSMGLSTGAVSEIGRQHSSQENLDPGKVLQIGLLQAGVNALAAIPGGRQADREALRIAENLTIYYRPICSGHSGEFQTNLGRSAAAQEFVTNWQSILPGSQMGRSAAELEPAFKSRVKRHTAEQLSLPDIDEQSTADLNKRIKVRRRKEITIKELAPDAEVSQCKSYEEFLENCIEHVKRPARLLYPSGHKVRLMVPEHFAKELDRLRLRRLEEEAGGQSMVKEPNEQYALPEDFLPLLDQLPNSKLVKQINLFKHNDPDDRWMKIQNNNPDFSAEAENSPDNVISFFKAKRNPDALRETLNHEWAHALENALNRKHDVSPIYRAAIKVERALEPGSGAYNANDYSRTNQHENWAVHLGEEMLAGDAQRFLRLAKKAPLRTIVLGRMLKLALTDLEQAETSLHRPQFERRIEFIEEKIAPRALNTLVDELKGSNELSAERMKMLDFLGWRPSYKQVRDLAKHINSDETAKVLVDTVTRRLRKQPEKLREYLYVLSNPSYKTHSYALDQFSPGDVEDYYKPKLECLQANLGAKHPLVEERLNDLSDWYQRWGY